MFLFIAYYRGRKNCETNLLIFAQKLAYNFVHFAFAFGVFSFLLLRLTHFYYKVRYTERRRDRKEDLPSDDSLPKRLQWPELH